MPTGGSKTTTTKNEPYGPAQPYLNTALAAAGDVFQKAPEYFKGDTVANLNPTQMAGINGIRSNANYAGNLATQGTNTLRDMMGGGPNPYLGKLFDIGQRDIANDVNSQFSMAGRYGSGAQTDVLSRNMGDMWTKMAGGAYDADQNRRLAATDRLQGMYDLRQQGSRDLLGAGSLVQAQNQAEIDAAKERWDFQQNAGRNNVDWLAGVASQIGGAGGTQTGQNPNYRSGTENLIGLGSTLGAAWLMSDRRLKTNIKPLGRDEFGMAWYSYRYHWDQPGYVRVGVMSDEVPAHAVRMNPAGFETVDYGAL